MTKTDLKPSLMALETAEAPSAVQSLLDARPAFTEIVRSIDAASLPLVVLCGRGSSGHVGVYLRYLFEIYAGVPVSVTAPSVVTALGGAPRLKGALFIVVSQSGASPDLVAATHAARAAGATTLALLNVAESPVGAAADWVWPVMAGPENSVAATKSVIASMAAGALLVAELTGQQAMLGALSRLPERLSSAARLDWSSARAAFIDADVGYVAGRGFGLATARETALKLAETLRVPALGYSAAELRHGPRAAITSKTPVLSFRVADATATTVDALALDLQSAGVPVFQCGGAGRLPWIGDDLSAIDAIAMLMPAYAMIEAATRAKGFDPDVPPFLSKVTETF